MASRGLYAQKVAKLKKETSKQRKESMCISTIDAGIVRASGIVDHSHDSREEVYRRAAEALLKRVEAMGLA